MTTSPPPTGTLRSPDWAWLRRPYGFLLVVAVLALAFAGRLSANPVQVGSGGGLGGSLTITKTVTSGGVVPTEGWTFRLVGDGADCQGGSIPAPSLDLLITVPGTGGTVSTAPFLVGNDVGEFCSFTLTEVPVAGWQSSLPTAGVTFTYTPGATLPAPLSWDGTNILAEVTNTPTETETTTSTTTPPTTTVPTTTLVTTTPPTTTTATATRTTSPATTSVSTTSTTPAPATTTTTTSPGLAVTGTNSFGLALLALVLMVTGSLALLASRRRAHHHD